MSWDVVVVMSDEDVDKTQPAVCVSDAEAVRAALSATLPGLSWTGPSWGLYVGDDDEFCIEIEMGGRDPRTLFVVHVWGEGDPVPLVVSLCREHGWRAFDDEIKGFLDLNRTPREGWRRVRRRQRDALVQRAAVYSLAMD